MSDYGKQFQEGFKKGRHEHMVLPEPPKIQYIAPKPPVWLETLVGIIAAWVLIAAVARQESVNGITLAIVGLAVTTVWCCLYMARR
jgi:hypothetical protein